MKCRDVILSMIKTDQQFIARQWDIYHVTSENRAMGNQKTVIKQLLNRSDICRDAHPDYNITKIITAMHP